MGRRSERGVDERLVVALIRGVHGLHGAVRAEVLTDRPEDRFVVGSVLFREGDDRPLTIAAAEAIADGPGWRIRFAEIATRDGADTLRGMYLESVVRADEDLARGSYYWHEVIGCAVRGVDGAELGTVRDIYRIGETEVFSVEGGPFGDFDLPAVRAFIRIFAPRRGEIVVDAESLDLRPRRSRTPDPDRPKAPRRRTRRKTGAMAEPTEPTGTEPKEPAESTESTERAMSTEPPAGPSTSTS
jgi:16S rRNA processing protein RimM